GHNQKRHHGYQRPPVQPVEVVSGVIHVGQCRISDLDRLAPEPQRGRGEATVVSGWGWRRRRRRLHAHRRSRFRNSFSSTISTPSWTALSYFDPGFSPATTKSVFFETLEVTFAPAPSAARWASSRDIASSPPALTSAVLD